MGVIFFNNLTHLKINKILEKYYQHLCVWRVNKYTDLRFFRRGVSIFIPCLLGCNLQKRPVWLNWMPIAIIHKLVMLPTGRGHCEN
jgi:hypothetical protein